MLLFSGCDRHSPTPTSATASAAPAVTPLVGQWRNINGTWRFNPDGTFWYDGGTTIQANPSGLALAKSNIRQGAYRVDGDQIHFKLKVGKPKEYDSTFRIDGRKLTIDGEVFDQQ